jgi:biotin synthase
MEIPLRHDWQILETTALFELPFSELLYRAHSLHREHHDPNAVQLSTLLSVKTGGCPEDCAYCPQSVHHDTGLKRESLMPLAEVIAAARAARSEGASRFCMGAAWRSPSDGELEQVIAMVRAVKAEGLETCATLGMLTGAQAWRLKEAGLDYYNHNLDTSPEFYGSIITTRDYEERLATLAHVREAGMRVCCGGILGMGETRRDRTSLLVQLANLPEHPESIPLNLLVQVEGTPLYGSEAMDPIEFVRTIAVARLMMPRSQLRLSAGRTEMDAAMQALCFFAGANSIFLGDKLLTTANPEATGDARLFSSLGMYPLTPETRDTAALA